MNKLRRYQLSPRSLISARPNPISIQPYPPPRRHASNCSKTNPTTIPNNNTTGHGHTTPSPLTLPFWTSLPTWRRASLNTTRCFIGCTSGDMSTFWFLQTTYPALGMGPIMGISSILCLPNPSQPSLPTPILTYK